MIQKWERLASRYVHRDAWLTARADRCRLPGGRVLDPFYVLEYSDWVNVVAVTAADEIVLVRQYRHACGEITLELPAGMMEAGEDPETSARRELLEETGYSAATFEPIFSLSPNTATHTNRSHSFLARGARRTAEPRPDETEDLETEVWPMDRVLKALAGGELLQALHVGPILAAMRILGK
ncbi:MAG: NUDIX hydrolase [Leptospirales bacterium]